MRIHLAWLQANSPATLLHSDAARRWAACSWPWDPHSTTSAVGCNCELLSVVAAASPCSNARGCRVSRQRTALIEHLRRQCGLHTGCFPFRATTERRSTGTRTRIAAGHLSGRAPPCAARPPAPSGASPTPMHRAEAGGRRLGGRAASVPTRLGRVHRRDYRRGRALRRNRLGASMVLVV